ncbi:hypothetical protein C3B58_19850, partial [Lactonifactor longoviformis]
LSKTIIGINMHICFLIERLVTKTPIETYEGIDEFIQNHQNFIRIVKESFCTLLGHYNVEIPVNEIAYLYEYICSDYEMSEEDKKCQRS